MSSAVPLPRRLLPWALPGLLLLAWQGAASLGVTSSRILPPPTDVLAAALRLTLSGELPVNMAVSTARAVAGLLIGGMLGFGLGLLNGLSVRAEALTDTTVQMLRTIPHLALVPLMILWLGIGEAAKLALVALGVLFPIYVNTFQGVRQVDPALVEMAAGYGLSRRSLIRRVILPGALPAIFVGLRSALGLMWLTLVVAETIAATSGLGHMAMEARDLLMTDRLVLSILVYALLGKLADQMTRALERRMLAWHPAYGAPR